MPASRFHYVVVWNPREIPRDVIMGNCLNSRSGYSLRLLFQTASKYASFWYKGRNGLLSVTATNGPLADAWYTSARRRKGVLIATGQRRRPRGDFNERQAALCRLLDHTFGALHWMSGEIALKVCCGTFSWRSPPSRCRSWRSPQSEAMGSVTLNDWTNDRLFCLPYKYNV